MYPLRRFTQHWFFLILVPLWSISQAWALVPNSNETVDHQFEAREVVYYSGFCGIDMRNSMRQVHKECDKSPFRVVLRPDPNTGVPQYHMITNQAGTPAPPNVQCDHFLELQVVNSVAMSPADTAPFPNNAACSAINAMLDTMDQKFPRGETYAEIKTSFIRESPLFTATNVVPNTYWVATEINQLKGKLIRRFLTENRDFASDELSAEEWAILPAVHSYLNDIQTRGPADGMASDLDDAWEPLLDKFHDKIFSLIPDEWPPTADGTRNLYKQKVAQLQAARDKFVSDAVVLDQKWADTKSFVLRQRQ